MTEAVERVIVHHAHGLHERVHDRGADEFEAAPLQILCQCIGLRAARGHLPPAAPAVLHRAVFDEAPDVARETAEFLLHRLDEQAVVATMIIMQMGVDNDMDIFRNQPLTF